MPEAVIALLDSRDPVMKETAWWIVEHRPQWGGALARFFQTHLTAGDLTDAARADLQQRFVQFADNPAIQELLAATVERADVKDERLTALRAMARTRAKELPSSWIAPLVRGLADRDADVVRAAIAVARAAPASKDRAPDLQAALVRAARDGTWPLALRLDALAALPAGMTAIDADLFALLQTSLEPTQPVSVRVAAASVFEKAALGHEQLLTLAQVLERAGPLELPRLLPAFDRGTDEGLGLAMLAALDRSRARSSIRADVLRPRLTKYPESVQKKGEALLASLSVDSARQLRRLEELMAASQGGDVRRGQAVFNSPKAACFSCHTIGYLGGTIGPDLTRIGQIRGERDLLEAILFPSASFARGYEPVVVTTQSGETHGGVLRSDLSDAIVIVSGAGSEIRILRRDIADMQPGTVSVMPPGLADQLSSQELADLLAFLKATRPGAH
jgi:putative heme-binding domain-containing protein